MKILEQRVFREAKLFFFIVVKDYKLNVTNTPKAQLNSSIEAKLASIYAGDVSIFSPIAKLFIEISRLNSLTRSLFSSEFRL